MKEKIKKLNFNIEEFKKYFWYSKTIEVPQFIKNIQPDITESELFNKLLLNVFQICDLFINQKMSQFLALDLNLDQISDILGKQRVENFISSVYTEIKYRLATEKFPEFSQKDKLITSNFSIAFSGREFNNFQSLLSAEAIAYLIYPSWTNLTNDKDDYLNIVSIIEKLNQFDNKIEKLLSDNSQLEQRIIKIEDLTDTTKKLIETQKELKNQISNINGTINLEDKKVINFVKPYIVANGWGRSFGTRMSPDWVEIKSENDDIVKLERGGIALHKRGVGWKTINIQTLIFLSGMKKFLAEFISKNMNFNWSFLKVVKLDIDDTDNKPGEIVFNYDGKGNDCILIKKLNDIVSEGSDEDPIEIVGETWSVYEI